MENNVRNGAIIAAVLAYFLFTAKRAKGGTVTASYDGTFWGEEMENVPATVKDWTEEVKKASDRHYVSPTLILAIIWQESAGNPNAISEKGAIGLMQLMPATAASVGFPDKNALYNGETNIEAGTRYLSHLFNKEKNAEGLYFSVNEVLQAYYAGPSRVRAKSNIGKDYVNGVSNKMYSTVGVNYWVNYGS